MCNIRMIKFILNASITESECYNILCKEYGVPLGPSWNTHKSLQRKQESTTVNSRTIVLSQSYYRVSKIAVSRFRYRTIVFSPSYYRVFTIAKSRCHYCSIAFSLSYCRVFTIVLSCFHRRSFGLLPSWYRCFVISTFHYRTIDFSLSYYRVFHHRNFVISTFCYIV